MPEPKESQKFINLGVVLNKKGEVLMIRRAKEEVGRDGSILSWVFPGGRLRLGESREESVRRGVLTETGYDIKPVGQISLRVHPQFFAIVVYHLCHLNSEKPVSKPSQSQEIAEIRWVKREDIPNLITTDLDQGVKKQLGLR